MLHGADRSASAVAAAERRVGPAAVLHRTEWAQLPRGQRFDVVVAVDVNLWWTRDPAPELAVTAGLLRPAGVLLLVHAPPPGRTQEVAERVLAGLHGHGWSAGRHEPVPGDDVVVVTAEPPG